MARCEVCGNEYDRAFEMLMGGDRHTFDSFECAIHALAPSCAHCGCKVIGHGMEAADTFYCCANCARLAGIGDVRDSLVGFAGPKASKCSKSSRTCAVPSCPTTYTPLAS